MKQGRRDIHQYDVAIIGAGHNGLVCAAYLAKSGKRVVLLEARQKIGGLSVTEEIADNVQGSVCAHLVHGMNKRVVSDLRLSKHGVSFVDGFQSTIALSEDERHLSLSRDVAETKANIADFSAHDANNYVKYEEHLSAFSRVLGTLVGEPMPPLLNRDHRSDKQWNKVKHALRKLSGDQASEFLQIVSSNVADFLDDYFETDLVKGALAHDSIMGNFLGPRSPGSMLTLMHRHVSEQLSDPHYFGHPVGGVGAISDALGKAALEAGADIRLGAEVKSLNMIDGRVTGVTLDDGQTISAQAVVSSIDPKKTFLSILPAGSADLGFVRKIRHWRTAGTAAKVNFSLDGIPEFRGLTEQQTTRSRLLICPSTDYLEFAFNHTKYGEVSDYPALEIIIPSALDRSLAASGLHMMSILVHYCPLEVSGGWDKMRDHFVERVIRVISDFAPDLADHIVAGQVLTPSDIEQDFGLTGGHWHHGDLTLDQSFFFRPDPQANHHETPVPGLYVCGAGSHPGGGITGTPGHNAAQVIIANERGRK